MSLIHGEAKTYLSLDVQCSKNGNGDILDDVHTVRLKSLTTNIINYKMKHMLLTNAKKQKSKYTSSYCHERAALFWFFQAFTLSL